MIHQIETVLMDFSGLKNEKEIKRYIPTQLNKYYPDSEELEYDYIIFGNGQNRRGLISFIIKDLLDGIIINKLKHPFLLFKNSFRSDGLYVIAFNNSVLKVEIKKGCLLSTSTSEFSTDILKDLPASTIVISDETNMQRCKTTCGKVLKLEKLYGRCKKNLFIKNKKSHIPKVFSIILVCSVLIISIYGLITLNRQITETARLEEVYKNLDRNVNNDLENRYKSLLEELYLVESQIPPNIYNVFYDLNEFGDDYKISDLNYASRYLRVNAVTVNSINLINNLNGSDLFNFSQNSTLTKDGGEIVNFSGVILCP